jgi:hypothetical protein
MPHHDHAPHAVRKTSGTVTEVFAHRFVLKTDDGPLLGDLTPHGAAEITLKIGDTIEIEGEQRPSELKVSTVTRDGRTVANAHKPPKPGKHDDHPHAAPASAIAAVQAAGYRPVGEPRRKPKHFEILGQSGEQLHEFHVELDGGIRKSKPVAADDPKWMSDMPAPRPA